MTFGKHLLRFELELNEKQNAYQEIEAEKPFQDAYYTKQQLEDFVRKKREWQNARHKYYAFKLFIYEGNVDLDAEMPRELLAHYQEKYGN